MDPVDGWISPAMIFPKFEAPFPLELLIPVIILAGMVSVSDWKIMELVVLLMELKFWIWIN